MRKLIFPILLTASLVACAGEKPANTAVESTTESSAEASPEQTYDLSGMIVGRSAEAGTLRVEHDAIGDWMGAMTMTFPVRGAQFDALPADGSAITATVHVSGGDFWLTDVVEAVPSDETETQDGEPTEDDEAAKEGAEISI